MADITPIRQYISPQNAQQQIYPPGWDGGGGCGCGPQPPSCFSQTAKMDACWDQSQSLYNLVSKVVMDIFTKNPGIIPPPAPGAGSGPIIGVTDGSVAAPGQVGELITSVVNGTFPPTANFAQAISAITLPPGDWGVSVFVELVTAWTTGTFMYLNPQPVGVGGTFRVVSGVMGTTAGSLTDQSLTAPTVPCNVKVPTLLAFTMTTNYAGAATPAQPTGNFIFSTYARRVR